MADEKETEAAENAVTESTEAAETTEAPPPEAETTEAQRAEDGRGESELDAILAQYEQEVRPQPQPQPYQPAPYDIGAQVAGEIEAQGIAAAAQERSALLERAVVELQQRENERLEREDFTELVRYAKDRIGDIPEGRLPPDYIASRLMAEAMQNPQLMAAWKYRRNGDLPESIRRSNTMRLKAAVNKIAEEARRLPDREASEDRAAIVQAVMRAGRGDNIKEAPPNLGSLSNRELNKLTEDKFGFKAI
jgi:hypothetical protein